MICGFKKVDGDTVEIVAAAVLGFERYGHGNGTVIHCPGWEVLVQESPGTVRAKLLEAYTVRMVGMPSPDAIPGDPGDPGDPPPPPEVGDVSDSFNDSEAAAAGELPPQ